MRSSFSCRLRRIFFFALWISACAAAASDTIHIYGIHSWGDGAGGLLQGKTGWTVEVVNTDAWPYDLTPEQAQRIRNEGWSLIIRINKFFGQTVPGNPAEFDAFAAACAQKVQTFSPWRHIWILGNEMNADFEGAVSVATYELDRLRASHRRESRLAVLVNTGLSGRNRRERPPARGRLRRPKAPVRAGP